MAFTDYLPPIYTGRIGNLKAEADIVDEATDQVTYLGFCLPGTTATSESRWSILKIDSSATSKPIVTTFKWANGSCSFNLVWDNRASFTYQFKVF